MKKSIMILVVSLVLTFVAAFATNIQNSTEGFDISISNSQKNSQPTIVLGEGVSYSPLMK